MRTFALRAMKTHGERREDAEHDTGADDDADADEIADCEAGEAAEIQREKGGGGGAGGPDDVLHALALELTHGAAMLQRALIHEIAA